MQKRKQTSRPKTRRTTLVTHGVNTRLAAY